MWYGVHMQKNKREEKTTCKKRGVGICTQKREREMGRGAVDRPELKKEKKKKKESSSASQKLCTVHSGFVVDFLLYSLFYLTHLHGVDRLCWRRHFRLSA